MSETITRLRQRVRANSAHAAGTAIPPQPPLTRSNSAMSQSTANPTLTHTGAWLTFTYVSFAAAAGMTALGIWALEANLWVKGYFMMAAVFLVGSAFTLAKTVRDEHEAKRFANRIEEAKTEKLLMELNRQAG